MVVTGINRFNRNGVETTQILGTTMFGNKSLLCSGGLGDLAFNHVLTGMKVKYKGFKNGDHVDCYKLDIRR